MADFVEKIGGGGELPVVAITMGDPAGVGPEVAVKALQHAAVRRVCRPVVVGDPAVLAAAARICGSRAAVVPVAAPPAAAAAGAWVGGRINVVASGGLEPAELRRGVVSAAAGDAGYRAIARAANAITDLRFSTAAVMSGAAEVLAYGTAVTVAPE